MDETTPQAPAEEALTMTDAIDLALEGKSIEEAAGEPAAGAEQPEATAPSEPVKDAAPASQTEPQAQAEPAPPPKAEEGADGGLDARFAIPSGIRGDHRKAYIELRDYAREQSAELARIRAEAQQAVQKVESFETVVRQAAATPDQVVEVFDYLRALNSGDIKGAMAALRAHQRQLARYLDEEVPGVDPLEDMPDLKDKVENLELSREDALELMRYRMLRQQQERAQQQQNVQQQQAQAWEAERRQAMSEVAQFVQQQQASDIDFPAKERYIMQQVDTLKTMRPALWPAFIKAQYAALSAAQAKAPAQAAQPLRARSGGGGQKEWKSIYDAVSAAVDGTP